MSTTTTAPLSATRPDRTAGLAAFVDGCSWVDRPSDFAPDCWLAVLLDERVRWLEAEQHGHSHGAVLRDGPSLPAVGDLPEGWLLPVIEDIEARYAGWRLAGDQDTPLIDRLDAHYAARQAVKRQEVDGREAHDADEERKRREAGAEADRVVAERDRALYGIDGPT
jgi:hypothetical protein